jgi:threonyl-tRNA synthetase
MITNLEDGTITFCDHDTFTDLCRGHIPNTGIIKAMKIMSAGAYWRGDEKHN